MCLPLLSLRWIPTMPVTTLAWVPARAETSRRKCQGLSSCRASTISQHWLQFRSVLAAFINIITAPTRHCQGITQMQEAHQPSHECLTSACHMPTSWEASIGQASAELARTANDANNAQCMSAEWVKLIPCTQLQHRMEHCDDIISWPPVRPWCGAQFARLYCQESLPPPAPP